jgi:uncharacterized protein
MRRTDREITDRAEMDEILASAKVLRLGMAVDGEPYVVPLHFGHVGEHLFVHSAGEGRKIEFLKKNPRICFEVTTDYEILPSQDGACQWAARFRSVIGFGRATFLTDPNERKHALDVMMEHYSGKPSHDYEAKYTSRIAVIRIDIAHMTGKKSGF